ncbi:MULTISPECIES: DUF433 domain-containing protein [unclassified Cupriavidus]|nr:MULTISPECIES: DUF433 domain-containing protein [unclassified Cupriavidus]MCA3190839.1 DUF433 domain-containing protein [Cupriavidus sp.]MCA3196446.1 DUF433 domain-containing protein [Cupriavidus sp.]MCA3205336.1 DUF433 domain-containing protein [Cupriavidus sp.]MCA3206363.1 DUF433 domain-containing protein [Cupriavidus sp.]MCA3236229.1 DUF433 domain-containing protein [Cupriavidus sp.]
MSATGNELTGFSISEVAFCAGLTDEATIHVVAAQVLSQGLVSLGEARRFAPIVSVFASFYASTNDDLSKTARLWIIASLLGQVLRRRDAADILSLRFDLCRSDIFDWRAPAPFSHVNLREVAHCVLERIVRLARATECVSVNPEVMGGIPVFAGTRLPIDTVATAKFAGASNEEIISTYPLLTPDLIEKAVIYQTAHPRRKRAPSLGELNPTWKVLSSKTVRGPIDV